MPKLRKRLCRTPGHLEAHRVLRPRFACCCRDLVDTMLESGNTLLAILGDILDFSKVCPPMAAPQHAQRSVHGSHGRGPG